MGSSAVDKGTSPDICNAHTLSWHVLSNEGLLKSQTDFPGVKHRWYASVLHKIMKEPSQQECQDCQGRFMGCFSSQDNWDNCSRPWVRKNPSFATNWLNLTRRYTWGSYNPSQVGRESILLYSMDQTLLSCLEVIKWQVTLPSVSGWGLQILAEMLHPGNHTNGFCESPTPFQ